MVEIIKIDSNVKMQQVDQLQTKPNRQARSASLQPTVSFNCKQSGKSQVRSMRRKKSSHNHKDQGKNAQLEKGTKANSIVSSPPRAQEEPIPKSPFLQDGGMFHKGRNSSFSHHHRDEDNESETLMANHHHHHVHLPKLRLSLPGDKVSSSALFVYLKDVTIEILFGIIGQQFIRCICI